MQKKKGVQRYNDRNDGEFLCAVQVEDAGESESQICRVSPTVQTFCVLSWKCQPISHALLFISYHHYPLPRRQSSLMLTKQVFLM